MAVIFNSTELLNLLPFGSRLELHDKIRELFFDNDTERTKTEVVVTDESGLQASLMFSEPAATGIRTFFDPNSYTEEFEVQAVHARVLAIQFGEEIRRQVDKVITSTIKKHIVEDKDNQDHVIRVLTDHHVEEIKQCLITIGKHKMNHPLANIYSELVVLDQPSNKELRGKLLIKSSDKLLLAYIDTFVDEEDRLTVKRRKKLIKAKLGKEKVVRFANSHHRVMIIDLGD